MVVGAEAALLGGAQIRQQPAKFPRRVLTEQHPGARPRQLQVHVRCVIELKPCLLYTSRCV